MTLMMNLLKSPVSGFPGINQFKKVLRAHCVGPIFREVPFDFHLVRAHEETQFIEDILRQLVTESR